MRHCPSCITTSFLSSIRLAQYMQPSTMESKTRRPTEAARGRPNSAITDPIINFTSPSTEIVEYVKGRFDVTCPSPQIKSKESYKLKRETKKETTSAADHKVEEAWARESWR